MASFARYRSARSIQNSCHMFSTLYVGACDVLVAFDDVCPTSSVVDAPNGVIVTILPDISG